MATHSSTFAWRIPWTEEPGRLQSMGSLRVGHDWATSFHFSLSCIGEGNGNPLQYSCLENPRDRGACWAAIYGVIQSRTQLMRLSSSSNSDNYTSEFTVLMTEMWQIYFQTGCTEMINLLKCYNEYLWQLKPWSGVKAQGPLSKFNSSDVFFMFIELITPLSPYFPAQQSPRKGLMLEIYDAINITLYVFFGHLYLKGKYTVWRL